MECPKCGRVVDLGAFICPGCDFILDTSFLGDDITDDERDQRLRTSSDGAPAWAARADLGGGRRFDDALLLHPDAVLELTDDGESGGRRSAAERALLALVNGKRSVARLRRKSGLATSTFDDAIRRLGAQASVRVRTYKKASKASGIGAAIPDAPLSKRSSRDEATVVARVPVDGRSRSRSSRSGQGRAARMSDSGEALPTRTGRGDRTLPPDRAGAARSREGEPWVFARADVGWRADRSVRSAEGVPASFLEEEPTAALPSELPAPGGDDDFIFSDSEASGPNAGAAVDIQLRSASLDLAHALRDPTAMGDAFEGAPVAPPLPSSAIEDVSEAPIAGDAGGSAALDDEEDEEDDRTRGLPPPPSSVTIHLSSVPPSSASSSGSLVDGAPRLPPSLAPSSFSSPAPSPPPRTPTLPAIGLGAGPTPEVRPPLRPTPPPSIPSMPGTSIAPASPTPSAMAPQAPPPRTPTLLAYAGAGGVLRPRPLSQSKVPFEQARKAEKIYEQAEKDRAEGRLSSAKLNAKLAVQFDPTVPAYRELLRELEAAGTQATATKPREIVLLEEAHEAEGRGDYDKAVALLEQAIAINGRAASLYNRLGVVLSTRLKRHEQALVHMKRALELEPGNIVFMNNYSKVTALLESLLQKDGRGRTRRRQKEAGDDAKVDIKKVRPKPY